MCVRGPRRDLHQRLGSQPTWPPLTIAATTDEPCLFEHLQVTRNRWKADRERLGKLEHRGLAVGESTHDGSPRRIRQCREDGVEGLLDDADPFEIDDQAAHLFKHAPLGIDDIYEVWESDPLFYPAIPPAHWMMVAELAGRVLVVPLAPPDSGDPTQVPTDRLLRGRRASR